MTTMNKVKPTFTWFMKQMWDKLALPRNQAKKNWRECGLTEMIHALENEFTGELVPAYLCGSLGDLLVECVDVANIAMMVADICNEEIKHQREAKKE